MCEVINGVTIFCSVDHKQERIKELEHAIKEVVDALSNLYGFAEYIDDCGPEGEGWQSDEFISALVKCRDVLESARRVLP